MHNHVELLAGFNSRGEPVLEQVPAEHTEGMNYRILATPGLVWGCARSDVVRVADGGEFEVVQRGGNVSIHISQALSPEVLEELRRSFGSLGGDVEAPPNLQFAVVTVPVSVGFEAIEAAANDILRPAGVVWSFGNVYGDDDAPLNWWI